jgi:hypothetical protein
MGFKNKDLYRQSFIFPPSKKLDDKTTYKILLKNIQGAILQ